jgi:hypothetical protein
MAFIYLNDIDSGQVVAIRTDSIKVVREYGTRRRVIIDTGLAIDVNEELSQIILRIGVAKNGTESIE